MCLLARRPWRRRLRLEVALPDGLRGPVDFLAFSRLASILAWLVWRGSSGLVIVSWRALCGPVLSLTCYWGGFGEARGIWCMWLERGGQKYLSSGDCREASLRRVPN